MTDKLQDDFLRPFDTLHLLSMLTTVAKQMQRFGLTADDALAIADKELTRRTTGRSQAPQKTPKRQRAGICPQCGSNLARLRVNVTKCTQVGGEWTHMQSCNNTGCNYTKLEKRA